MSSPERAPSLLECRLQRADVFRIGDRDRSALVPPAIHTIRLASEDRHGVSHGQKRIRNRCTDTPSGTHYYVHVPPSSQPFSKHPSTPVRQFPSGGHQKVISLAPAHGSRYPARPRRGRSSMIRAKERRSNRKWPKTLRLSHQAASISTSWSRHASTLGIRITDRKFRAHQCRAQHRCPRYQPGDSTAQPTINRLTSAEPEGMLAHPLLPTRCMPGRRTGAYQVHNLNPRCKKFRLLSVDGPSGIEPATTCLEGRKENQHSQGL